MLRLNDGSIYTGYTTDVKRRLKEHNESKKGAKATRAKRPCTLVYTEEFETKSDAMSREWFIKNKMSKEEKEELVKHYERK